MFIEKAEITIDGDEDDVVLCLVTSESKKECKNKKVWFAKDVKQPLEAGMMCMIDGDVFFCSQKISGLKTQVHHAISPTTILAIQGSSCIIPTTKKGKL